MDSYQCEDCEQCFEVGLGEDPLYYDEFFDGELARMFYYQCPHCGSSVRLSW